MVCGTRQGNVFGEQLSDRTTDIHSYTHVITAGWVLLSPELILNPSDLTGFLV